MHEWCSRAWCLAGNCNCMERADLPEPIFCSRSAAANSQSRNRWNASARQKAPVPGLEPGMSCSTGTHWATGTSALDAPAFPSPSELNETFFWRRDGDFCSRGAGFTTFCFPLRLETRRLGTIVTPPQSRPPGRRTRFASCRFGVHQFRFPH
jgi:hypothetical protein